MKFVVVALLSLLPALAQAQSACRFVFRPVEEIAVAKALADKGTPDLIAARLAADYPEIADRIQNRKNLEWVTLYRGVGGDLTTIDPHFYRKTPGGNFIAPPLRIGINNGIFAARDQKTGEMYAQFPMYAKGSPETGTVIELRMPRFLVTQHFLTRDYMYIPRSNTPELDLWIHRYAIVPNMLNMLKNGKGSPDINWQPYETYYFSKERAEQLPGPFARAMAHVYRVYNKIKLR